MINKHYIIVFLILVFFTGCGKKIPSASVQNKIDNYIKLCNENNAEACFTLSGIYAINQEVERDPLKMTQLLEKSCALSYYDACYGLGYIELGKDIKDVNTSFAKKYLLKAINGGLLKGNLDLALMYDEGKVIEKDTKKAFSYYLASCTYYTKVLACERAKELYIGDNKLMSKKSFSELLLRLRHLRRRDQIFTN